MVMPWLVFSLLLHGALLAWVRAQPAPLPIEMAPSRSPLQLTLSRPEASPPAVARPREPSVPEVPVEPAVVAYPPAAQPPVAAQPVQQPLEDQPLSPGLRLDLSFPDLSRPDPGRSTENGATVMNPELLGILRSAPRRSGVEARSEREASGEFQAGAWVEYVRHGDACFRVQRANVLASFDYDVWYRVACP